MHCLRAFDRFDLLVLCYVFGRVCMYVCNLPDYLKNYLTDSREFKKKVIIKNHVSHDVLSRCVFRCRSRSGCRLKCIMSLFNWGICVSVCRSGSSHNCNF